MLKLWAMKDAYLQNKDGATAIEYGLIAAGLALGIATILFIAGDNLETIFGGIRDTLAEGAANVE